MFDFVERPVKISDGEFGRRELSAKEKIIVSPGICPTFMEMSDIRDEEYPQPFISAAGRRKDD